MGLIKCVALCGGVLSAAPMSRADVRRDATINPNVAVTPVLGKLLYGNVTRGARASVILTGWIYETPYEDVHRIPGRYADW